MDCLINGIHYHVEIKGTGYPLVLLHGFTGDSTTWDVFERSWSKERQVISIDIVGHGKSDSPSDVKRYEMLSAVRDIKEILDLLHINKTDILGYSMGGRLALSIAMEYPLMVRKLLLESASPGLKTLEEREARRQQDEKLSQYIVENGIEKFVAHWENIPLFSTQKKLSLSIQRSIQKQRLTNSLTGLSNSLLGMGTGTQPSWWDSLDKLEADTLLLTGSYDQKFCQIAEEMYKRIKQVEWTTIEKSGHAIHVEQPEKFGTIVSRFLSQ